MFKCLLHATDLQQNHLEYCEQAVKIAKSMRAQLYFLHVLEIPQSWQIAQSLGFAENQPLPIEETKMILRVLADQFDLPSEHMLLMEGTPKHQIIECINELEVDLLLVGSRTNPILQAEITHLTHYLADHSPCNMMLMRPLDHDF